MFVFFNGRFVPEEHAAVSVFDRGFLYGDGVFETMRVVGGRPFRWELHLDRLRKGAEILRLQRPFTPAELRTFAGELIECNQMPDAILRLTLSRGIGPRGYSPKGADRSSLVMTLHPAQKFDPIESPRWRLVTSSVRLNENDALAGVKTCNKLPQILARAEADERGADEALLLNTRGEAVEGTSSNLFWIDGNMVCTPPLSCGVLAGVTRAVVLELCRNRRLSVKEVTVPLARLRGTDGIFLTNSGMGLVEAKELDGASLASSLLTRTLERDYRELVQAESAAGST